jgi:hypothetical protein
VRLSIDLLVLSVGYLFGAAVAGWEWWGGLMGCSLAFGILLYSREAK